MKKLHVKHWILFLGLIILSSSCLKKEDCGDCVVPPPQIYFKIVDVETNENLINNLTYSSDSLKLFYLDGENTTYLDIIQYDYYGDWVLNSRELSLIAWENTEETFYLQLNHHDKDTIFVHVGSVFENCCTYYLIDELMVNDIEPEIESRYNIVLIKK